MWELWIKVWNCFWNICCSELQNVDYSALIICSFIGACIIHLCCFIYVRVKSNPIHISTEIMVILLFAYMNFMIHVTLLSRTSGSQLPVIDLKLLWIDPLLNQNITNFLNILLFVPFGALVTDLHKKKQGFLRTFFVLNYCFIISLMIECLQYITRRGYFELDDIEANVLGGLIGNVVICIGTKIGKSLRKSSEVYNE